MRGSQTVRREAQWTPIFRLEFAWGLGLRGIVVGPNWMTLSDRRVTLQSVRQAIGGELFTVDPSSPFPSPTQSQ